MWSSCQVFLQKCGHRGDEETYELSYNIASGLADVGDLSAAQAKLTAARETGLALLASEGAAPEDVHDELAGVNVQLGYVYQLQGNAEEALKAYESVLAHPSGKLADAAVAATANNSMDVQSMRLLLNACLINVLFEFADLVSLRHGDSKIFDSLKKQDRAFNTDDAKLSARQKAVLQLNRCLLLLVGNQADKCRDLLTQLQRESPESESPTLVLAALAHREKNSSQALSILSVCV